MADSEETTADETAITFDLQSFFDQNSQNIGIVSAEEVPDSILGELLDEVNKQYPAIIQKPQPSASPASELQKSRFPVLTTDEIDEIANNTCKKKTRKQITWGIKVFRGKFIA